MTCDDDIIEGHDWIDDPVDFVAGFDWEDSLTYLNADETPEDRTGFVEVYRVYPSETDGEVLVEFTHDDSSAADGIAHFLALRADTADIDPGVYWYRQWSETPDDLLIPGVAGVFTVKAGVPEEGS